MSCRLNCERLEPRRMLTEFTPVMLADFSPGSTSSEFSDFHAADDRLYFNVNGSQVWQTDGTPNGTGQIADATLRNMFNDMLYGPSAGQVGVRLFNATVNGADSVWRTDGTSEGTFEVIANRTLLTPPIDATHYAVVVLPTLGGAELWRVGETRDNSFRLAELDFGAGDFDAVAMGGDVYLSLSGQLYRTDGSVEGTEVVAAGVSHLQSAGDTATFFQTSEAGLQQFFRINSTDGSLDGLIVLPDNAYGIQSFGDNFMFIRRGHRGGNTFSLDSVWVSDGTEAGTVTTNLEFEVLWGVERFEEAVILAGRYGGGVRSDGTLEGTFYPGGTILGYMGDKLLLGNRNNIATYTEDGVLHPAFPPEPAAAPPGLPAPPVDAFWKYGEDHVRSYQFWGNPLSDADVYILNADGYLTLLDGEFALAPQVDVHYSGDNWYATAQAPEVNNYSPTVLLSDQGEFLQTAPQETLRFISSDDKPRAAPLYFDFETGGSHELWAVGADREFEQIGGFEEAALHQNATEFFFSRTTSDLGTELWASDGTSEGTLPIDIMPGSSSSSPEFVDWNGATLVIADSTDRGREMWSIEGSFAETPFSGLSASVGFFDIKEGHPLSLSSSVQGIAGRDVDIAWDLNGDGEFGDAVGADVVVPWAQLQALEPAVQQESIRPIQVRVSAGQQEIVNTGFLRVTNDAPQILGFRVPVDVRAGSPVEIQFDVEDPVDQDRLQYSIDLGDGTRPLEGSGAVRHVFDRMGIYDIRITVNDGDGGTATESYQLEVANRVDGGGGLFSPGPVFGGDQITTDVDAYDVDFDGRVDELLLSHDNAVNEKWSVDEFGALTRIEKISSRFNSSNSSVVGLISDDENFDVVTATNDWLKSSYGRWKLGEDGLRSSDLALGDLNGDGLLDLFVANVANKDGSPAADYVLLQDPERRARYAYTDGQEFNDSGQRLGPYASRSVKLSDFDGDGDLDAVTVDDVAVRIWRNDSSGAFTETSQLFVPGGSEIVVGDLDLDGDQDLFLAADGPNQIWLNDGGAQFSDTGQRLGDRESVSVALGDLDLDGDLDVFVGNRKGDENTIWLNNGDGTFNDSGARIAAEVDTLGVALADLDRDGDLDAIAAVARVPNHIYMNNSIELGDIAQIPGDLDGDATVGFADFLILSAQFGKQGTSELESDIDGDGRVGLSDFQILAGNFGRQAREA